MAIELKAESDIRSRRICLFLSWTLPLPRLRLRLMRRLNTYPADADDGDCVFDWVPGAKLQLSSPDEIPLALEQDEVDGQWRGWGRLVDGDLTPEQVYYYRLFAGDETKTRFYSHQDWQALCLATGEHGFGERLYHLLPALHRTFDAPSQGGQNQLRRFMGLFGAALDNLRSQAEGLRDRHDVLLARADLLPYLARLIGWDLDRTLEPVAQRQHILAAPEIYDSVGAEPNIRALVNMYTGWDSRVKEFGRFIAHSASPETGGAWQIWEQIYDEQKDGWHLPTPLVSTDEFVGHPAIALDSQGRLHLFWHSKQDGPWQIWQRVGNQDQGSSAIVWGPPQKLALGSGNCCEPAVVVNSDGLWLFWASDSAGGWDIWRRSPDGAVQQVTAKHEGADRYPAVVAKDGFIWLFWSSTRRGQVDIWWMKQAENGAWEAPQRLTTSQRADDMPSAAVGANGGVWLCWSAYLGDRRNLYGCVHDGNADGQWSEPAPLTQGAQRDEAPALINWKDKLHLFWQSDRPWSETESRPWRIWQALWTQTSGLSEAKPVTDRWLPDKETAVVSDGERLRLFWRWQQHRTLTVDTGNSETRQRLSTFQDTTAYTYDCGRFDDSLQGYQYDNTVRYNRQTIGIFMLPDRPEETFQLEREWEWVGKALRQFLPIHVRAVYAIQLADADSYPTEKVQEDFSDLLTTTRDEIISPVEEITYDEVPKWRWFISNREEHRTVNTEGDPVDTSSRTWHTGLRRWV